MQVNIKNGQHNHKAIVADILLCTFIQLRSVYKRGSTLHVLCSDVCCIACWDNSPKAYSKSSVLGLACESTFWLTPSLPHCLSWLCMLFVLSSNLGKTFFEPQKPRDNRNHDNTTLRQVRKTYCRSLSMNMVRSRGEHQVL